MNLPAEREGVMFLQNHLAKKLAFEIMQNRDLENLRSESRILGELFSKIPPSLFVNSFKDFKVVSEDGDKTTTFYFYFKDNKVRVDIVSVDSVDLYTKRIHMTMFEYIKLVSILEVYYKIRGDC